MSISMNIKKLREDAILPTYGSASAAGADLYACEDEAVTIEAGQTKLIHTGLAMAIPEGLVGLIYARSGLASKRGLAPANKVGVIDSDYRGEIMVALHNHGAVLFQSCHKFASAGDRHDPVASGFPQQRNQHFHPSVQTSNDVGIHLLPGGCLKFGNPHSEPRSTICIKHRHFEQSHSKASFPRIW